MLFRNFWKRIKSNYGETKEKALDQIIRLLIVENERIINGLERNCIKNWWDKLINLPKKIF